MILRVIRGRADRERLEALRVALGRARAGRAERQLARVHLGFRPVGEDCDIAIVAVWDSMDAAVAADARRTSALALATDVGLAVEPSHFEIDTSVVRSAGDEEVVALRIATGRFSHPGADVEMQELLRTRMPDVEDDMVDAYVGRRMVKRSIDVTFVSAWRRLPPGRDLQAPFWPDIALRYDAFEVEVYTTLELRPD